MSTGKSTNDIKNFSPKIVDVNHQPPTRYFVMGDLLEFRDRTYFKELGFAFLSGLSNEGYTIALLDACGSSVEL